MSLIRIQFTTDTQLGIDALIDLHKRHEPLTLAVSVSKCGASVGCIDEELGHLRPIYRATVSSIVSAARVLADGLEPQDMAREALCEVIRNSIAGLLVDLADTESVRLVGRQLLGCIVSEITTSEEECDNGIDPNALVAWEQGDLDEEQVARLFQRLIDTGTIAHLQGTYQREAHRLVASGACRGR